MPSTQAKKLDSKSLIARLFTDLDAALLHELPRHRVIDVLPFIEGLPEIPKPLLWQILRHAAQSEMYAESVLRDVEFRIGDCGFTMEIDLSRTPEYGYYIVPPNPEYVRQARRGGRVMIDIGGFVGFHTLVASCFFDQVFTFEPTTESFSRLQNNVERNRRTNVVLERAALSDRQGQATLRVSRHRPGKNTLREDAPQRDSYGEQYAYKFGEETVATRTLDSYTFEESVDLIKIDVEGSELEVMRGATGTIGRHVPAIFLELKSQEIAEECLQLLPPGYRAWNPKTLEEIAISSVPDLVGQQKDFLLSVRPVAGS